MLVRRLNRRQRLLTPAQFEIVAEVLANHRRVGSVQDLKACQIEVNDVLVALEITAHCILPCGVVEAMKSVLERATEPKS